MEKYVQYIEESMSGIKQDELLIKFKKETLDEMTRRANEITGSGMTDAKVISDIIIGEHPDLKAEYEKYVAAQCKKMNAKKFALFNVIGSATFMVLTIIIYLGVSFVTNDWGRSWLIIMGGVSLLVTYLLGINIKKTTALRRAFHPIARVSLALAVMMITTFIFLVALVYSFTPNSWLIWLAGVICIFIADAAYAHITKQKFAVFNYLIYIPSIAAMVYVILGFTRVIPWHPGWLIMLFAVLADLLIVLCKSISTQKYVYKQEETEEQ